MRVGLGVEDEIVQAAPGALDLLELRRVEDLVHLRRQLLVEARDHLLDRVEDVVLDRRLVSASASLHQRRDRVLDLGRRALGARLEALLQNGREFVGIARLDDRLRRAEPRCLLRHG